LQNRSAFLCVSVALMRENLKELRYFFSQNPLHSLPWRSLSGPYASPSEVAHGLSSYGRKIANLELVFPFPKPSKEKLDPFLNSYTLSDTISISPHACFDKNSVDSVWCQSVSSRGKYYLQNSSMYSRVRNKRTPLNKRSPWNISQKQ
jgi:hypothetical protein